MPISIVVAGIIVAYDFTKMFEGLNHMLNVHDGHPQKEEFTLLNYIWYPVRRAFVNLFVTTIMLVLSGF